MVVWDRWTVSSGTEFTIDLGLYLCAVVGLAQQRNGDVVIIFSRGSLVLR
jgi:hypothetical protein